MAKIPPPRNRKGKISAAEMNKRVELAAELLAKGYRKGKIKQVFREQFSVSFRSVERYLARARKRLRQASGMPPEDHISDSLAFYQSITRDANATESAKLRARENIDKLLGLRKPFKIATTDAAGNDLPEDELAARRERVANALEVIKQRGNIRRQAIADETSEN